MSTRSAQFSGLIPYLASACWKFPHQPKWGPGTRCPPKIRGWKSHSPVCKQRKWSVFPFLELCSFFWGNWPRKSRMIRWSWSNAIEQQASMIDCNIQVRWVCKPVPVGRNAVSCLNFRKRSCETERQFILAHSFALAFESGRVREQVSPVPSVIAGALQPGRSFSSSKRIHVVHLNIHTYNFM